MSASAAELRAQLAEYDEQIGVVAAAMLEDPDNDDLAAAKGQLDEVRALTADLLATAERNEAATAAGLGVVAE